MSSDGWSRAFGGSEPKGNVYRLRQDGGQPWRPLKKKVRDEENPVLQYLDSIGYSISEVYMGQEPTMMSATAMARHGRKAVGQRHSEGTDIP